MVDLCDVVKVGMSEESLKVDDYFDRLGSCLFTSTIHDFPLEAILDDTDSNQKERVDSY